MLTYFRVIDLLACMLFSNWALEVYFGRPWTFGSDTRLSFYTEQMEGHAYFCPGWCLLRLPCLVRGSSSVSLGLGYCKVAWAF